MGVVWGEGVVWVRGRGGSESEGVRGRGGEGVVMMQRGISEGVMV